MYAKNDSSNIKVGVKIFGKVLIMQKLFDLGLEQDIDNVTQLKTGHHHKI